MIHNKGSPSIIKKIFSISNPLSDWPNTDSVLIMIINCGSYIPDWTLPCLDAAFMYKDRWSLTPEDPSIEIEIKNEAFLQALELKAHKKILENLLKNGALEKVSKITSYHLLEQRSKDYDDLYFYKKNNKEKDLQENMKVVSDLIAQHCKNHSSLLDHIDCQIMINACGKIDVDSNYIELLVQSQKHLSESMQKNRNNRALEQIMIFNTSLVNPKGHILIEGYLKYCIEAEKIINIILASDPTGIDFFESEAGSRYKERFKKKGPREILKHWTNQYEKLRNRIF